MHTRALALASALLLATCAISMAAGNVVASVDVPLDGTAVSLPRIDSRGDYTVRLSGTLKCDIDGRSYDAAVRSDSSGAFTQPHDLLVISPSDAGTLKGDAQSHIYTLGPLEGSKYVGESVIVQFNVNRLVDEFIRPPSEVRSSLSGGLKAELLRTPRAISAGVLAAVILIPLLLVGGALGLIVSASRRAARQAFEDVETVQRRIGRKAKEALAEIGTDEGLFHELRSRVKRLAEGADELARHVISFREARLQFDREEMETEISRLQGRQAGDQPADLSRQFDEQLAARRQALAQLKANEESESRYLLRLSAVETTLDNLRLQLPRLRVDLAETGADQAAVSAVDAELRLLTDAISESRADAFAPVPGL